MSAIQHWGAGDWAMFALNVALVLFGLYSILFAARIEARQQAKREAMGEGEGGGYKSPLSPGGSRTLGLLFLAGGAFGLYRILAPIWFAAR
jgi:hypothetical protein